MDTIKKELCCTEMQSFIDNPYCPLKYQSCMREYLLMVPDHLLQQYEIQVSFGIQFCPLCGIKLPPDLIDEWMTIIEKRFHMSGGFLSKREQKKIPKEFKTDEWWRKRGL